MAKPTHDDAMILLQLAQMMTTSGTQDALGWLWSEEFKADPQAYRPGSPEFNKVHTVLGAFETIGTLYKHHLINEDLLFDWLAVTMVWNRVRDHVLAARKEAGSDALYENFELLAKADEAWQTRHVAAVGATAMPTSASSAKH